MKIRINKGVIYDEQDNIIGAMNDLAPHEAERTIELGAEAIDAIKKFVADVNSGSFKPRSAVKEFELLLAKYEI